MRMTLCEKIRGQKYRKGIPPLGEQVLARRPGANVNQLLWPWATGLWLGCDTLSDEHPVTTSAGIMRSRAVRRLQESVRWVPEALQAMPFTPCAPHLHLRGRTRLQTLAYEEPIEAGTLPRFIEAPTATAKQEPMSAEKFVTLPSDAEQSTKREQEIPTEQFQPGPSHFLFLLCRRDIDACS